MFLDVRFDGNEVLLDEAGGLLVFIRLGVQPSTSASRRCGAEIEQERPVVRFGFSQRLINVSAPIDGHGGLLGKS